MTKKTIEHCVIYKFDEALNFFNTLKKEVEATMVAFTGMVIGTFKAVKTEEGFEVTTAKGKVLSFNKDGVQTNAKNAKFANKLQVA